MADAIGTVVEPFLARVDDALGAGYTAVLFGSVARGEQVEGRSDLNLMLIVERADPAALRSLHDAFAAWRHASRTPPILISRDEWSRAADAFPIELCDMKTAYRILRGPDLLASAALDVRDLRRALEHELRGKLLRFRQAYVAHASDPAALGRLAADSAATVVLLLRCTLMAAGRPVPSATREVTADAASLVGFPAAPVAAAVGLRSERKPRLSAADFEAYLDAVSRTARFVDQLQPGDQS
jgi:predicted nucleotidyltransferase